MQNGSITLLFIILNQLVLLLSEVNRQVLIQFENALGCNENRPCVELVEEHEHLHLPCFLDHRVPHFFLLVGHHNAINDEVILEAAAVVSGKQKLGVVVKSRVQQLPGPFFLLAEVVERVAVGDQVAVAVGDLDIHLAQRVRVDVLDHLLNVYLNFVLQKLESLVHR